MYCWKSVYGPTEELSRDLCSRDYCTTLSRSLRQPYAMSIDEVTIHLTRNFWVTPDLVEYIAYTTASLWVDGSLELSNLGKRNMKILSEDQVRSAIMESDESLVLTLMGTPRNISHNRVRKSGLRNGEEPSKKQWQKQCEQEERVREECWNSGRMRACAMHRPHLSLFRFSLCCSYLCTPRHHDLIGL